MATSSTDILNLPVEDILGAAPASVNLAASQATKITAVINVLLFCALVTVFVRFFVIIRVQKQRPALDDWMMLANLVPLVILTSIGTDGVHYGLGKHIWIVKIGLLIHGKKILYIYLVIYMIQLWMLKISLLFFFRRSLGMSWLNWVCLGASCAWGLGSFLSILLCADPISYFWNGTIDPTGGHYRIPAYNIYIGTGAGNIAVDTLVFLVPIQVVWMNRGMRFRQKLLVSSVFGVNIVVVAASIIRLHYLTLLRDNVDLTWDIGQVLIWSTVEPGAGIILACLPAFQPFVRYLVKLEYSSYMRSLKRPTTPSMPFSRGKGGHRLNDSDTISPADTFDSRLAAGYGKADDKMQLTIQALTETDRERTEREKLEHYLGPMFIRVQHDIELQHDN